MIAAQVPELADGGYWYAVEATHPEDDPGGWTFSGMAAGACIWYAEISGTVYCAIRTPSPVAGIAEAGGVLIASILDGVKPHGRVGGY